MTVYEYIADYTGPLIDIRGKNGQEVEIYGPGPSKKKTKKSKSKSSGHGYHAATGMSYRTTNGGQNIHMDDFLRINGAMRTQAQQQTYQAPQGYGCYQPCWRRC